MAKRLSIPQATPATKKQDTYKSLSNFLVSMGGPISKSLQHLLGFHDSFDWNREIDLVKTAAALAEMFGDRRNCAMLYLDHVNGKATANDLLQRISDMLPHDSTVRDMLTGGHLAKVLSRWELFQRTNDVRIIGLPHAIFDELSWRERNDYFRLGVSHDLDGDIFESREAQQMMLREKELLDRHMHSKRNKAAPPLS